ncbi:hypothetical protein YC2023_068808 [Brassica napus]
MELFKQPHFEYISISAFPIRNSDSYPNLNRQQWISLPSRLPASEAHIGNVTKKVAISGTTPLFLICVVTCKPVAKSPERTHAEITMFHVTVSLVSMLLNICRESPPSSPHLAYISIRALLTETSE